MKRPGQFQYLNNCAPTLPLTQQQSTALVRCCSDTDIYPKGPWEWPHCSTLVQLGADLGNFDGEEVGTPDLDSINNFSPLDPE